MKREDDLVKAMKARALKTKVEPLLPRRPGYGTVGKEVMVRANYFRIQLPQGSLFLYDAEVQPEVKNKKKLKRLFQILEKHPDFQKIAKTLATDYSKLVVSTTPLKESTPTTSAGRSEDRLEFSVLYTVVDGEVPRDEDKARHKFKISRVTEIHRSDIDDYLTGRNPEYNLGQAVQAMNIILSKYPHKSRSLVPVGRNKFFVIDENSPSYSLGRGLTALKGYFTSVRPTVGHMLLNVNVCTTAFYTYVIFNFILNSSLSC